MKSRTRAQYKYHYVYIIRNKDNGMYYKGKHSTNDLNDKYAGSGVLLKKAYKEFGRKAFTREIVNVFYTEEEAYAFERSFVTEADMDNPLCLNTNGGGFGGRLANSVKERLSEATKTWLKVHGHPLKGTHSEGVPWTEDRKRRVSLARSGSGNPMYGKRGSLNSTSKAVICVETGEVFGSTALAAEKYGVCFQNISKVLLGERKTCGGYHWVFQKAEDAQSR